jgi:hypothetical protein
VRRLAKFLSERFIESDAFHRLGYHPTQSITHPRIYNSGGSVEAPRANVAPKTLHGTSDGYGDAKFPSSLNKRPDARPERQNGALPICATGQQGGISAEAVQIRKARVHRRANYPLALLMRQALSVAPINDFSGLEPEI